MYIGVIQGDHLLLERSGRVREMSGKWVKVGERVS